jgi:hypothetical protein
MSAPMPPDDVTRDFWAAAAQGRFLLQHDAESGGSQFFPRPVNVHGEAPTGWRAAAGTGTLLAVTTARVAAPGFTAPYLVGIVRLDEGPRVFAPLLNAPPDIAPGRRMRWIAPAGDKRYAFEPVD